MFFNSKPMHLSWWDTPDGENIVEKTDVVAKLCFLGAMPIALIDHYFNPQKSMKVYGFRAAAVILPLVGAGTAFALTTQTLCARYPKQRPEAWYAVGGVAAGTVLGGAARSPMAGAVLSVYIGLAAAIVREMANHDLGTFFGELPLMPNNDDVIFAADYRINPQPIDSMPLPMARPGRPHSTMERMGS